MGIQSVVDDGTSGLLNQAMCSACEMAAVWMESELTQNQTQERILAYAAELCDHIPTQNQQSAVDCGRVSSMPIVTFSIGGRSFDLTPQDVTTLISFSLSFQLTRRVIKTFSFFFFWSISIYSRSGKELSLSAPAVSRQWILLRLVDLSGNYHLQIQSTNQQTQMGFAQNFVHRVKMQDLG